MTRKTSITSLQCSSGVIKLDISEKLLRVEVLRHSFHILEFEMVGVRMWTSNEITPYFRINTN